MVLGQQLALRQKRSLLLGVMPTALPAGPTQAHRADGDLDASAAYTEQARAGLADGVQSPRAAAVLAGVRMQ